MNDFVIINNVLMEYVGNSENVIIPDTVDKIAKHAFHNCIYIKQVTIPSSVTQIGECAFHGCHQLENVEFLGDNIKIDAHAFVCSNLSHVTLPKGLTSVSEGMFANCKNLISVQLPDSVNTIGKHAFMGCEKLESINISDGIESIGEAAFEDCDRLIDKDGFVIIKNILFHYAGKKHNVVIPDNVTRIDWNTFFHYIKLSITTYSKELQINRDAFRWNVKLTVNAPLGSRAEQFAKQNNIPFNAI